MRFGWTIAAFAAGAAWAAGALADQQYVVTVRPAASSSGYQKVKIAKAVLGGREIRLWANYAINPDCTEVAPGTTLAVIEPPAHGRARISEDPSYPDFPASNVRSACNSRKVPMKQAFYQAEAGFQGRDRLVLEGSLPAGVVRRITVEIEVR